MKHQYKIGFLAILLSVLVTSCQTKDSLSISNKLTTFIPEEKILVEHSGKKLIESSSGNYLRDAIRMIKTDARTDGYFTNLSLINSAISNEHHSFTFSGTASSTINDYPITGTQQIVVTIEKENEELFYELSFGSTP